MQTNGACAFDHAAMPASDGEPDVVDANGGRALETSAGGHVSQDHRVCS